MTEAQRSAGWLEVAYEGPVAVMTICREHKHNALSPEILQKLETKLSLLQEDPAIRAVVITGQGERAFIAGNDIDQLAISEPYGAFALMEAGQRLVCQLRNYSKPTVAMVNGYALGGGLELALACDFILASSQASFGFPEIGLNTFPGWGGTQLAVRAVGLTRAKEMIMSGGRYSAEEALQMGLINRLYEPSMLYVKTLGFLNPLIKHDANCLGLAKRLCNGAEDWPLADGLRFESALYSVNFSRQEARDGFKAFLNKPRKKNG
jgi:enoyl-CoA hydratase/carnithine racemase